MVLLVHLLRFDPTVYLAELYFRMVEFGVDCLFDGSYPTVGFIVLLLVEIFLFCLQLFLGLGGLWPSHL